MREVDSRWLAVAMAVAVGGDRNSRVSSWPIFYQHDNPDLQDDDDCDHTVSATSSNTSTYKANKNKIHIVIHTLSYITIQYPNPNECKI